MASCRAEAAQSLLVVAGFLEIEEVQGMGSGRLVGRILEEGASRAHLVGVGVEVEDRMVRIEDQSAEIDFVEVVVVEPF